jgi:hypothetical protein
MVGVGASRWDSDNMLTAEVATTELGASPSERDDAGVADVRPPTTA